MYNYFMHSCIVHSIVMKFSQVVSYTAGTKMAYKFNGHGNGKTKNLLMRCSTFSSTCLTAMCIPANACVSKLILDKYPLIFVLFLVLILLLLYFKYNLQFFVCCAFNSCSIMRTSGLHKNLPVIFYRNIYSANTHIYYLLNLQRRAMGQLVSYTGWVKKKSSAIFKLLYLGRKLSYSNEKKNQMKA